MVTGEQVRGTQQRESSRDHERLEQAGHAVGLHTVATPVTDPIGVGA